MARRFFFASAAVLGIAPALLAQQFVYNAAALPAQNLFTDGVRIADLDGDGDNDILFADAGGTGVGAYGQGIGAQQQYFKNNGAGIFAAAHASLGLGSVATRQIIVEDIDLDGDLDILYARDSGWPTTTAPPIVLINTGAGTFTDESALRIPAGFNQTGFGIAGGDVDNDGDIDVVVTDGGTFSGVATQTRLLINDGSGFFTNETATRMPVDLYNGNDVTMLDVDNDFDIDICVNGKGATNKRSRLYVNNGAGVFSISNALDQVGTSGTYEVDYGDFDGDNDFDAVVQSISGSLEGWAQNVGTAAAWPKTTFTNSVNQDDNEQGCLDYDNDGDLDCIVGSLAGWERVYTNNAGVFSLTNGVIQQVTDSTLDYALGDLNGDHKYDLVTGQGESGSFLNRVYMNNGPADTLPPTFDNVETPASVGPVETIFRVRVSDAISEDGYVNATVSYAWTSDVSSGSGQAVRQGLGQFRAAVPTAGATQVDLTWTATDTSTNAAVFGPISVSNPATVWSNQGRALAGVSGNPSLVGTGPLTVASAGALTLTNAAPSAACILFVSISSSPVPFKGGTLCAFPVATMLPLATDGSGGLNLPWASWQSGLSGLDIFFQYGISDGAAIHGVSLSNCEKADVP